MQITQTIAFKPNKTHSSQLKKRQREKILISVDAEIFGSQLLLLTLNLGTLSNSAKNIRLIFEGKHCFTYI